MLEIPPDKPRVKLPNIFLELASEDLRVTGVEKTIRCLWTKIKQKTGINEIKSYLSQKFNLSISSIERLISGRSSIQCSFVREIYEIWKETCKPSIMEIQQIENLLENSRFKGNSNSIPVLLPKFLTPKLAYLIGALRDGSLPQVYNNQYEIQFSQKNVEWLKQMIVPLIKQVFKINAKIQCYGKQTPRVKVYSKPIYVFIKKVFEHPEKLQVTWEVPSLIRNSPI